MADEHSERLTEITRHITISYPETAVFIGEIAVWQHCLSESLADFGSTPHEGDFIIGKDDFMDLKDRENIIRDPRLGKYYFHKSGFTLNVHVQGHHDFAVPVEEIISESVLMNGVRVADQGHLLKVAAATTAAPIISDKEQEAIIRILLCLRNKEIPANVERLDDDDCDIIKKAIKGEACVRLCRGNLHDAKMLRSTVQEVWSKIQRRNDPKGYEEV